MDTLHNSSIFCCYLLISIHIPNNLKDYIASTSAINATISTNTPTTVVATFVQLGNYSNIRYANKSIDYKPKSANLNYKRNDNPPIKGDNNIVVVISQVNIVANVKEWVIDSAAT